MDLHAMLAVGARPVFAECNAVAPANRRIRRFIFSGDGPPGNCAVVARTVDPGAAAVGRGQSRHRAPWWRVPRSSEGRRSCVVSDPWQSRTQKWAGPVKDRPTSGLACCRQAFLAVFLAAALARANTGNRIAARMAMIAITTSSSMRVNARRI